MKYFVKTLSLLIVLLAAPLAALDKTDFDSIIDFSVTLEELSEALETGNYSGIDGNKLVILNGMISIVRPDRQFFFMLNTEDVKNPGSFIRTLQNKNNPVSVHLDNFISEEVGERLNTFGTPSAASDETALSLLKDITNDLKRSLRRNALYDRQAFAAIDLDADLQRYALRDGLEAEELAMVNRLLMEAAFPNEITGIAMQVEIVYGAWIGYDEVKSYKSIITFRGVECFKIFKRKLPEKASPEMISVNATVLIVARIDRTATLSDGRNAWLLDGLYIREVR